MSDTSHSINARTKEEYVSKVKAALKADYSVGSIVDIATFRQKYGVKKKNVREAIVKLAEEGYRLHYEGEMTTSNDVTLLTTSAATVEEPMSVP